MADKLAGVKEQLKTLTKTEIHTVNAKVVEAQALVIIAQLLLALVEKE